MNVSRLISSVLASVRLRTTARARRHGASTSPISRRAIAALERRLEEEGGHEADSWPPSHATVVGDGAGSDGTDRVGSEVPCRQITHAAPHVRPSPTHMGLSS